MSDLLVIVPSRGRPENIRRLYQAWRETNAAADLVVAIDADESLVYPDARDLRAFTMRCLPSPHPGMTAPLNEIAGVLAHRYAAVGFMGDDHVPRTPCWDDRVLAELAQLGTGIVYGNDLIHGARLPTAVFMSSVIVQTLGYMAPPRQWHLWLDNAWLALGQALGAIRYLPDVVIEHLHPLVGKAESDEGYERVNHGSVYEHDRVEFERWQVDELPQAVEAIRASTAVR